MMSEMNVSWLRLTYTYTVWTFLMRTSYACASIKNWYKNDQILMTVCNILNSF